MMMTNVTLEYCKSVRKHVEKLQISHRSQINAEPAKLLRRRRRAIAGRKTYNSRHRSWIGFKLGKCLGRSIRTQDAVLVLKMCIFHHQLFDTFLEQFHLLVNGEHQVALHEVLQRCRTQHWAWYNAKRLHSYSTVTWSTYFSNGMWKGRKNMCEITHC